MRHKSTPTALKKVIDEENQYWTAVFKAEMKKVSPGAFSSFWWEDYYFHLTSYVKTILSKHDQPKILESGCGSGKASILLGADLDRTLLDISDAALTYAKTVAKKFKAKNIHFVQGNIFDLPFKRNTFHFVWNIGVIEHYDEEKVLHIFEEMFRVTQAQGHIVVAVPNFSSGPLLKARLLKLPFLARIPGYRVGTEKNYSVDLITTLLRKAAKAQSARFDKVDIRYFGNPLPMETPRWILKTVGVPVYALFPHYRFLKVMAIQIEK